MPTTYYPGPGGGSGDSRGRALAVALALVAVLALVVILYHALAPRTLAKGLTRRGWTVYLREGCGFCHKQMGMLGGFDRYVLHGANGALLGGYTQAPPLAPGSIRGYPHWHNPLTGEARTGLQDAAALERMAR